MASTYSSNLRLELVGDGEQQGVWGSTTNTNLGQLLEQAIGGFQVVTMGDSNYTLTVNNGALDEARNAVLRITSSVTLTATRDVVCPTIEKTYIVKNATTGGQSIVFKTSGGLGVTIPNGSIASVYVNGTDVIEISQTPNTIASGGTGASTASGARTNLGLGTIAVQDDDDVNINGGFIDNVDITGGSITSTDIISLATPLAVADGGTGNASFTAGALLMGDGTSVIAEAVPGVDYLVENDTITLSGDVSGSGKTAITATLANTAVTPGSYTTANITVDAKGRITAASSGSAGGVTSFSAGTTGLTPSTGTTGAVTLGGTLALANGGTGATTQSGAANAILPAQTSQSGKYLTTDGTNVSWATVSGGGTGTVTSVAVSGGTTGLTTSGGPITTSGTITIAGTLAVANGGTGSTTASGARTNLGLGTIATQNSSAVSITGGSISGLSSPLAIADGGTGSNSQSGARSSLGLGSSATYAIGTSGSTVPLMSGANTWSGAQTFTTGGIVLSGSTNITASNTTSKIIIGGTGAFTSPRIAIGNVTDQTLGSGTSTGLEIITSSPSTNRYPIVFNNGTGGGTEPPICGKIITNGTGTSYQTTSDYRVKKDVTPISGGCHDVLKLNPVTFRWKGNNMPADIIPGFIAHEVQAIIPAAVDGQKDAVDDTGMAITQSLDMARIVPLLTAALKEAILKIDGLESRIATLEAKP